MGALMSIGKSALYASYASLQTTGNNIANANTPGYSRQEAQLADSPGQFTGAGFFGKGVSVTTVTRAYDRFLTNQAVGTQAIAQADAARSGKLAELENLFPLGATGVGYAAGEFLNSFVDVANLPTDSSARQVVLSQAQELAARFQTAGDQLNQLQAGVVLDARVTVSEINSLATHIASLNQEIAKLRGTGQPPNTLLDQRDQLIGEITAKIGVTTIEADDGSVGVFIGGGQNLVLGSTVTALTIVPDTFDSSKIALAMGEGSNRRLVPSTNLVGGSLSGLLRFQNDDLNAAGNLLGQMAAAVSGAVNLQQSLGLDLGRPAGAGAPLFSVGAARVLKSSENSGTALLTATATAAAGSASQLQASDYEVGFDGSNYTVRRLSDNSAVAGSPFTPAALAGGVQFDGVSLQLASGTAVAGDRFMLQPTAQAAGAMRVVLASAAGIAAAAPFVGRVDANNTGTATVASVVAVDPAYDRTLSTSIVFTSATGDYSWSMSDGTATTTGTGTWAAGTPIALNGYELTLAGVPANGDRLSVTPTTAITANNGNALAFAKLSSAGIVAASGNSGTAPQTITDAYASAIANIGVRVQGGKTAASISGAIAAEAESARVNKAGVNLDEEAARLIQFQQSYQAAAKILQVAQSIFDTMLRTAGG
jgi:flagellar hook-associated protein 1